MKKRNNLLTFILVSLLVFSLLFVFACKPPVDETPPDNEDEETTQETRLITNGTFASGTNSGGTNEYLKDTVNGWTKTNGATYYSSATMGVVDLGDEEKFNSNIKVFYEDGIAYPAPAPSTPKNDDGSLIDTNALMVALPGDKGSVYYRNTSAVTLTANKYYKLSIDVYTSLLGEEGELQGAWLIVNNSVFAEFKSIDTDSTWQTYEVYIEANNFENRTFYVELWLGYGPKYLGTSNDENLNPRLSKGFAFFDNVILEEVDKQVFTDKYDAAGKKDLVDQENKRAVLSLYYADPGFTYETKYSFISPGSTTSKFYYSVKSGSPQNYKMVVGKTDAVTTNEFPSSSYSGASGTTGIFDLSKLYKYDAEGASQYTDQFALLNTADNFKAPRPEDFYDNGIFKALPGNLKDTEALLIYHPNYSRSGLGYTSNQSYLIQKGKYYEISVWAYIWAPKYGAEFKETAPTAPSEARPSEPLGEDATEEEKNNAAAWENYDKKLEEFEEAQENFEKAKAEYYAAAANSTATFKLTGASIKEGGIKVESDPSRASFYASDNDEGNAVGQWQPLTIRIQGNELSDRKVNFEFWYGEGEWGSDTLKVGGAIFDNINIKVYDQYPGMGDYEVLSQIQAGDYSQFGLHNSALLEDEEVYRPFREDGSDLWDFSFEDKKSDTQNATAGYVSGAAARDAEAWAAAFPELPMPDSMSVTENNAPLLFNLIMLYNKQYTATKLVYADGEDDGRNYITINPNAFYRLSVWIRTDGIDENFGVNVSLFDEADASLSTLTKINTEGEWKEVTFFLRGSSFKVNNAYLEFKLGTGNIVTPASHVKGAAYATAITYQTISYTEYNAAVAGTYSAKKAISDTPSTTNSITNGYFAELNTTNYEDKKDGEKIFDENGNLIGVAVPASWTLSSGATSLPAPVNVKIEDGYLKWDKVDNAEDYYIYMDGVKLDDNVTKNNVLIHKTGSGNINQYEIAVFRTGSFKVRAVRNMHGDPYQDGADYIAAGVSPYSTSVTNTLHNNTKNQAYDENLTDLKTRFGIINYKNYADTKDIADTFYPAASDQDKLAYKSNNSDYLLMLESDYYTRGGYTSSSISLSANSYYVLGVWVKTLGDAQAGITINNTSKVFAAKTYNDHNTLDGDYTGYVNINTEGEWVQYRFYIETTVSSASLQLELFLGNKYAEGNKITVDNKTTTYPRGLSKGTVYFDDVSFISVPSKEEFDKLAYGGNPEDLEADEIRKENTFANLSELEGHYFENQYIFKLLDYTTDSFDIFTAAETDDINGGKPQDYTHYTATAASDYDSKAEEPAMLYGVYDKRKTSSASNTMVETIATSGALTDATTEEISAFLSEAMGNNYLLLANLIDNGQYYLSNTSITIAGSSYYKITFFAKTWIPEGKYGEFRFEYGNDTGKFSSIRVTSEGKEAGLHQYSFYVANTGTDSISGSKISFYLGSNSETASDATPTNFFKGLMVIDNISVAKLSGAQEYDQAILDLKDLDEAAKLAADFSAYEFVAKAVEETPKDPTEPDDDNPRKVSSEVWLLIASIFIGAVLIAVIVVLTWRKIKKKIKRAPAKVISNVPVNMTTAEQRKAQGGKKKDIADDEFKD